MYIWILKKNTRIIISDKSIFLDVQFICTKNVCAAPEKNAQPEMLTFANECDFDLIVEKNMFQMPSTSQNQPMVVSIDDQSTTNASNSCLYTKLIQNESAPNNTRTKDVCIAPTKRQRKPKYGSNDHIYIVETTTTKRSRVLKPKVNSIKIEQPSLQLPQNNDATGEYKPLNILSILHKSSANY